jgi:aspartate dehydrogenase
VRVALLGGGTISLTFARKHASGYLPGCEVVALASRRETPRTRMIQDLVGGCRFTTEVASLVDARPDVILEAARPEVLWESGIDFVDSGSSLVVMSSTCFRNEVWFEDLWEASTRSGARVVVPSGAIGSIDLLRAVSRLGEVDDVLVELIKDPETWPSPAHTRSAPGTQRTSDSDGRTTLFEGNGLEAMALYPTNLNVVATISLAGIGPLRTRVKVVADATESDIVHKLIFSGRFGSAHAEFRVKGNPDDPRWSFIPALSAIEAVRGLTDPVRFGT